MKRIILLLVICISVFGNDKYNYETTFKDEIPNDYKHIIKYSSKQVFSVLFENKNVIPRESSILETIRSKPAVRVFLSFDTKDSKHNAFEYITEFERINDNTLTVGKIIKISINGMSDNENFSKFIGKKYTKNGEYNELLPSEIEDDGIDLIGLFALIVFIVGIVFNPFGKSSSTDKKSSKATQSKTITTVIFNNSSARVKYKQGSNTGNFSIPCDEVVNWSEHSVTCKKYLGNGGSYRIWSVDSSNKTIDATTVNK